MNQRGITLIELLAAIAISAIIVVLVNRLFLTSHHQFLDRLFETKQLHQLVRVRAMVNHHLHSKVIRCSEGSIWLKAGGSEMDLTAYLMRQIPEIESSQFSCFEVNEHQTEVIGWQGNLQPQLIEYRIDFLIQKKAHRLEGSLLK